MFNGCFGEVFSFFVAIFLNQLVSVELDANLFLSPFGRRDDWFGPGLIFLYRVKV
jgi:hypothetical protein